jgi:hypothetical protein
MQRLVIWQITHSYSHRAHVAMHTPFLSMPACDLCVYARAVPSCSGILMGWSESKPSSRMPCYSCGLCCASQLALVSFTPTRQGRFRIRIVVVVMMVVEVYRDIPRSLGSFGTRPDLRPDPLSLCSRHGGEDAVVACILGRAGLAQGCGSSSGRKSTDRLQCACGMQVKMGKAHFMSTHGKVRSWNHGTRVRVHVPW